MSFAKFLRTHFLQDTFVRLLLISISIKLLILTKFFHSINIVGTLHLISRNLDFVFYDPKKFEKHKPLLMFSRLRFYSWVIIRTIFSLKNVVRYLWTFNKQITLCMVFLKHNSLKSDICFNSIFIPCFSESMCFRFQVFRSPGFSGSRFFGVHVLQGPIFSGSRYRSGYRFFRVQVLGPGLGLEVARST